MSLNFIVLYSSNPELTVEILGMLGMRFVSEKHDGGPEHFAHNQGQLTVEVYPTSSSVATNSVMLGFTVGDLQPVRNTLIEKGLKILKEPANTDVSPRLIARDGDGLRLFIQQS